MNKKQAYNIVMEDILQKGGILTGKYDAKHGNKDFMNGIFLVVEFLAFEAGSEEKVEEVTKIALKNRLESEKRG